ncbi:MAG: septation protein SepH [Pseudonocardia sp.]
MRALRVVGITDGDDGIAVVLEDPDRRERFTVPADEQLRVAARGDRTRLGQIAIEVESQLRPREIQTRIRAGASVEQVATAAGVPQHKIERFAYPVLLERSRSAELAQGAHPVRSEGPESRTLGEVVAHTFGLRGQEYEHAEWDSWKGEDGKWVVALSWRAGRSDNRAHWTFHPGAHGGTVTAVDEHASDLVEGLPARPLRTVGPVIYIGRTDEQAPAPFSPAEERAAASDRVRGPGADADTRPAAERTTAHAPPEKRRPAASASHQPESRPAEPQDAPAAEAPADPSATDPPVAEPGTDTGTAPVANRRTKKGKPVMPSWDEVLLGVRGQR